MASDRSAKEQLGVDLPEQEPIEAPVEDAPVVEDTRPEWLPDKFKEPSDVVAAYHELEEELRRRAEADKYKDEQIAYLMEVQQQPQPQQQPQQSPDQWNEQLQNAYAEDPIGTMVFLQQQAAQQAAQQVLQQYQQTYQPQMQQQQVMAGELMATNAERVLEQKYPDWSEYGAKVGDVLERNPLLMGPDVLSSLDRTAQVLESIYKQVKYDDVAAQLEASGNDQTRMKMQAQTVSGNAGRPGQPDANEEKINRLIAAAKNSSYSSFRGGA